MHEPKQQQISISWMFCVLILLIHNLSKIFHRFFYKGSIDGGGAEIENLMVDNSHFTFFISAQALADPLQL